MTDFLASLTYERVLLTLVFIGVMVDVFIDWKSARPHKRRSLKAQLVDEGIALAERTAGPSDVKLRNAVDWAEARAKDHQLNVSRNELAKLVEIRLPRDKKKPAA